MKVLAIFPFILGHFFFDSNAINFFIHFLNRFAVLKKCSCVAGFLQSGALYANIRHELRSEYNQWKTECSKHQRSWGVWGCSETPSRVFGGEAPYKSF